MWSGVLWEPAGGTKWQAPAGELASRGWSQAQWTTPESGSCQNLIEKSGRRHCWCRDGLGGQPHQPTGKITPIWTHTFLGDGAVNSQPGEKAERNGKLRVFFYIFPHWKVGALFLVQIKEKTLKMSSNFRLLAPQTRQSVDKQRPNAI